MIKNVVIAGSTGSIGRQALDVIQHYPDRYRVVGLSANDQWLLLYEQCCKFRPEYVYVKHPDAYRSLFDALSGHDIHVLSGSDLPFLVSLPEVDVVLASIVGVVGMVSTYAALEAGKVVLLANKESLIAGGPVLMEVARRSGATVIPIDSEHSALLQCLMSRDGSATPVSDAVNRLVLTASGGPFWPKPFANLGDVTPEQVCNHPRWSMGRKISVDSATMANKGLEIAEACWLFGLSPDRVGTIIHPESVVHALVEYIDGVTLTHMSYPDMRTALSYALSYPERSNSGVGNVDLASISKLSFYEADFSLYPCLKIIIDAVYAGHSDCIIVNAANEVAVQMFLSGQVKFTDIETIIADTYSMISPVCCSNLSDILSFDREVRVISKIVAKEKFCALADL
ncbi:MULTISPECIES: 1-deoxy-D-xylulose-5-phosphate reductoisomerase [Candidatus Ichthyocystis]|uniref:1-deoxy-D-xylulose 5-phosphate reductoisomerase n=1 Tax=Candidatus Ichthyocystis hellenicum TaxID=1561003 RepID=A0A0S4M3W7_9BURK|nr:MULTISPECIES: 1-deoxy-D-xylulose-5-phosphate reductoisomerase [Ichthyocystis]CUT16973.1 1-deoxy-D-xylulose 5-phosphate reductoisomerase [Candidatus Ichthyocystis hellenicum]